MLGYFFKRLLLIIPTFIGVTLLVFAVTRFVPGGPVERALMEMQMMSTGQQSGTSLSDAQIEQLKAFYGMDKPVWESYLDWFGKLMSGDLGKSTLYQDPVIDMILDRLPVTAFFGVTLFILSYIISIPLGIAKAKKHSTWFDNASSMAIFVGYAIPGYVAGILMLSFFSYQLDLTPMGGFISYDFEDLTLWEQIKDILWHAILPLIAYAIADFAFLTMTMKNSLMENLSADYVRTAIAKGLPFNRALTGHAMRNSLIPIASHFGGFIGAFFAGSFLIEAIFSIDGIGLLGYESLMQRDYPVVMGILVFTSLALLVGNIISDMCVALVDPRVRFDS